MPFTMMHTQMLAISKLVVVYNNLHISSKREKETFGSQSGMISSIRTNSDNLLYSLEDRWRSHLGLA